MNIIIDYGMGNLLSVKRAFEECGGNVVISEKLSDIASAEKIILPGVGSFLDGMKNIINRGFLPLLKEAVFIRKVPLLGICLGMQLLADKGYEGGKCEGLGFIHGEVKLLEKKYNFERIPHVGWNEVSIIKPNFLFDNIRDGSDFYFTHSYHFLPLDKKHIIAITPYCGCFVSVINKEHIFGVQFHPEKSIPAGFQLIRNFLRFRS